jgi:3'5'-cyclic nucleotide phosphodiesterase
MTTYWCDPNARSGSVSVSSQSVDSQHEEARSSESVTGAAEGKCSRLVDWTFELFLGLLGELVACRDLAATDRATGSLKPATGSIGTSPLDEAKEVLDLPRPNQSAQNIPRVDKLPPSVASQLRELIVTIASMYRPHAFHNFEHVSHTIMSALKLFGRISEREHQIQCHTTQSAEMTVCGITTAPLTKLAIVFSALIHDLDHPGVSNAQLINESNKLAMTYNGKSVAEQNSIDMAWSLLLKPRFDELRSYMFATEKEMAQFRQIVVNAVLSTDLFDKDLKDMRESRWTKSLGADLRPESHDANRRATIVLQLIIQASDVSHTMQHFTIYQKWNQNLLTEMYDACLVGRTSENPLNGWYEGELWFFDNYVIPLAQKMHECGVFGVSCDELMACAKDNRAEWKEKGRDIVRNMTETLASQRVTEPQLEM